MGRRWHCRGYGWLLRRAGWNLRARAFQLAYGIRIRMTENQFQAILLSRLRKHSDLKEAVIWKLSDRFTRGIPDVLISLRGVTTYFELKVWPNGPTKIQAHYLKMLSPRGHVVTRLLSGQIV